VFNKCHQWILFSAFNLFNNPLKQVLIPFRRGAIWGRGWKGVWPRPHKLWDYKVPGPSPKTVLFMALLQVADSIENFRLHDVLIYEQRTDGVKPNAIQLARGLGLLTSWQEGKVKIGIRDKCQSVPKPPTPSPPPAPSPASFQSHHKGSHRL
jgi:hypothetical protein